MKQYQIDCYEVLEADGVGIRNDHLCFVGNEELAKAIMAKSPNWRCYTKYSKLITIFETEEEIEANSKENLRKSALAKLSEAEKKALGF